MEEQPLVTIRCITYNHEPYIRQCLEGFVMQKTNFKFEAIVHDDASTDKTADIIREYAEKYPDIIKPIYETENQYSKSDGSLGRIMNAHTKGKYIALCEGDDYWTDPLKLQKQVDFLENNPEYGMCFTNVDRYFQDSNKWEKAYFDESISDEVSSLSKYIIRVPWIATCTWVLRSKCLKKYNPLISGVKMVYGDLPLVLHILLSYKVHYLPSTTTVYRVLNSSASHGHSLRKQYKINESILKLRLYYCEYSKLNNEKGLVKHNYYKSNYNLILCYGNYQEIKEAYNILREDTGLSKKQRFIIRYSNIYLFRKLFCCIYKLRYII